MTAGISIYVSLLLFLAVVTAVDYRRWTIRRRQQARRLQAQRPRRPVE